MIRYDLQFFANKDGPGGQKTEAATPKKLNDARKKGQVAKSRDLTGAVSLLAFFIILKVYSGTLGAKFIDKFNSTYMLIQDVGANKLEQNVPEVFIKETLNNGIKSILILLIPIFVAAVLIAFVVEIVQVKWKPTGEPLKPKFNKFNPVNGVKRIFSTKTLVQLIKQIAIVGLCVLVAYNKLKKQMGIIFNVYDISLKAAIVNMGDMIFGMGINISIIYLIIGVVDYIYEKFKFKDDMKMTKQAIKDEMKDTEGKPEIKSKQRQKMMEASRRRMMSAIPEADVVITNPTHFAAALKYEPESGRAPVVVAKGEDYLALKIKEKAKECEVEIVENKPLARMLYYNVDIDAEIPQELYQAVAEVLAFVWKLKNKI